MTVNELSSLGNTQQTDWRDKMQQRKQDFDALSKALNSGDLAGAQKAFAAVQQDMQANKSGQAATDPNRPASPLSSDMDALSKALSSGDLAGAQKAFSTLQQDMQQARQAGRGHHHHHSQGTQGQSATTAANATALQLSVNGLNLTA